LRRSRNGRKTSLKVFFFGRETRCEYSKKEEYGSWREKGFWKLEKISRKISMNSRSLSCMRYGEGGG
jgi:hypothetical protein